MRFIRQVFDMLGYSPFDDLSNHANLCMKSIEILREIFERNDLSKVEELNEIEKEADRIKTKIMNNISSLILPVNRFKIYNLITIQDNIINTCKDLASFLKIRRIDLSNFRPLIEKIVEMSNEYKSLYNSLKEIVLKAFIKSEVDKVYERIRRIERIRDEYERLDIEVMRDLFRNKSPEDLIFIREIGSYFGRIVENISNSAKAFGFMLR